MNAEQPVINEVLIVAEVAALLKMSKGQIYTLTRHRAAVRNEHPIPVIRINGNLRFLKSDIEGWLRRLSGTVQ